jgi:hypothetical protein
VRNRDERLLAQAEEKGVEVGSIQYYLDLWGPLVCWCGCAPEVVGPGAQSLVLVGLALRWG